MTATSAYWGNYFWNDDYWNDDYWSLTGVSPVDTTYSGTEYWDYISELHRRKKKRKDDEQTLEVEEAQTALEELIQGPSETLPAPINGDLARFIKAQSDLEAFNKRETKRLKTKQIGDDLERSSRMEREALTSIRQKVATEIALRRQREFEAETLRRKLAFEAEQARLKKEKEDREDEEMAQVLTLMLTH